MKINIITAAALICTTLFAGEITVYRKGRDAWIQSRFSETHDIVIGIMLDANERSYLVPRGTDIREAAQKGMQLHANSDEYPAVPTGLGTFSGNHGSPYGRLVTAPKHGLTMDDSGKVITDENGIRYVIVNVPDENTFFMHPFSQNQNAPLGRPKFKNHKNQKLYFDNREIKFTKSVMGQLRPLNLIRRNVFLVDGKTPLPDQTVVKCKYFDHLFDHDVAAPEEVVKYINKNPGAKTGKLFTHKQKMFYLEDNPDFSDYAKTPVFMKIKNRMRYEDNGSVVSYRSCCYPVSLSSFKQMDVMFGWGRHNEIARGNYQMFYIPKIKPISVMERGKQNIELDFARGTDIAKHYDFRTWIDIKSAENPDNPPDRYVRVTGKNSPEYGIALGYSMIVGDTALDKPKTYRTLYYSHRNTKKIYPYAFSVTNNKPGLTFNTVAYKQYFAPSNDPDAVYFYYHTQGDHTVVYFEAHKVLENKLIKLPKELVGKSFSVVEKTPSVTLLSNNIVPKEGVKINISKPYGYIVLKVNK